MKKIFSSFGLLIGGLFLIHAVDSQMRGSDAAPSPGLTGLDKSGLHSGHLRPDFDPGAVPLYFVPNAGRTNPTAPFYARTSAYTLWITPQGLVFDSIRNERSPVDRKPESARPGARPSEGRRHRDVSRTVFLDANKDPDVIAVEPTGHRLNSMIGRDPAAWEKNVPTSAAVRYEEIYRNIDLKVYGAERQVEYDWIVKPGGSVSDIRISCENVQGTEIDREGNLVIRTRFGRMTHKKPAAYQIMGEERVEVEAGFDRIRDGVFGLRVGTYDETRPLIIDPVILVYSTYLGGRGADYATRIAVDNAGAVYITGETVSADFPVGNAFDGTWNGSYDAFAAKLSAAGDSLVYSTFLGGSNFDLGRRIALDGQGNAFVVGSTYSADFPVRNALDSVYNGDSDVFVAKISPTGNTLAYSTYIGGSQYDEGVSLAIDSAGSAYVVGSTNSSNFPKLNPYDLFYNGGMDAFFAKLNPTGSGLVFSTWLGEGGEDFGTGIAVDATGAIYVTGYTNSTNFPTRNAYLYDWMGGFDGFVTKFTAAGNRLVYSTYLGGGDDDFINGIVVDDAGNAHLVGDTMSADFPAERSDSTWKGGYDAFVSKLNDRGDGLEYSLYLGGGGDDFGYGIASDKAGSVYVAGLTESTDFPVLNAYDAAANGAGDAFIAKICPLYPPLNFALQRRQNNYFFFKEYINRLSWQADPNNRMAILAYRLHRKAKDAPDDAYEWLAEFDPLVTGYDDRGLKKTGLYTYRITAIDEFGRESDPAEIGN